MSLKRLFTHWKPPNAKFVTACERDLTRVRWSEDQRQVGCPKCIAMMEKAYSHETY